MTEPVTLEFLGRLMERLLDRIGGIEDQVSVLTGMVVRLDGAVRGFQIELDAFAKRLDRLDRRVRNLEENP